MKVLVYGAGAVGLGIASCLIESGADVAIVSRKRTVAALSAEGLRRTGVFGDRHHDPASFTAASNIDPYLGRPFDYVLICTKSFDTAAVAAELSRLATSGGEGASAAAAPPMVTADASAVARAATSAGQIKPHRFVLFQNGWGNREVFSEHIPSEAIYNARVITGFSRPAPAEVCITVHADDIHVGFFNGGGQGAIEPLCDAISTGGVPCSYTDQIIEDLWAKMLYNCSLNSLGAVFEVNYGKLADNPASAELLNLIIDECFSVMTAAGYKTHWQTAAAYREVFYSSLIPVTRDHFPSTLQDIQAGKKTEIDAMNGAVVRLADENGIEAPYNRMAYSMVKYKETRSRGPG